jgi:hypothetical protein
MRPELLSPEEPLDTKTVLAVLQLVEVNVNQAAAAWTPLELALAYDWAAREHLAASDSPVKRRPKPSFVEAAEKAEASRPPLASAYGQGPHIHQAVREIIAGRGAMGATERLILDNLAERGLRPAREILQRWLEADQRDDLIALFPHGRWRATEKLEPMLYLSKRFPPEEETPGRYMQNWTRWIGTLDGSQQPISQDLAITIGAAQAAIAEVRRELQRSAGQ